MTGNRTPIGANRRTSTYSQSPFQNLVRGSEGNTLSSATAFYFESDGKWFLITNWHVVSGRNFLTGEPIDGGGEPTSLVAKLSSYDIEGSKEGEFAIWPHDLSLYEGEHPVWLEHPCLGRLCDVVAIPTERPETCPKFMHNAANLISVGPNSNIPIRPGGDVFIIGFPRSISVGFGLPLWKSGYIASEPQYDVDLDGKPTQFGRMEGGIRVPAFFVDAQTRKGISGSPVFARYFGTWDMNDPYAKVDFEDPEFGDRDDVALWSEGTRFVGCYSGRIVGDNVAEAGLGLCWRQDVVETICRRGKPGRNPHLRYQS